MQQEISHWLNWLRMKVSADTVRQYAYCVKQLEKIAPDRPPAEWTTAQLLEYLASRSKVSGTKRSDPGMGEAMRKQAVSAFRSFFGYTCPALTVAKDLPMPKVHRRKQRTLTPENALKLLASCDTASPIGTRNLAIMTVMLDSGLRASEVCRLRIPKMDFEKRRFVVVVKGGDEDIGVFSKTTSAHIERWLSVRERYARPDVDTLFVSIRGGTKGAPLTSNGLRVLFRKIGQRAGIGAFSPHDLRRTFATIAIRNGAPTRVVQAAGRWGDLGLVERYTQDIQAEDFERYSPVESLLKGREE
jgi:site-specific recombinase XerD